jgi:23S rRNA G2445 N2-methylase RlmL
MQLFNLTSKIVVTCSNRLAPFLAQEIQKLGLIPTKVFKTGVELQGTMQDCIWLNLNLRCASQVLFSLQNFTAYNATDLYNELVKIEWAEIIADYFSITSNVFNDTINNNLFANVKVKDAIVDYFRNKTGERPNSGPDLSKAVLHLYWQADYAEIFVDTSGETLSKHGYRKIPGKAPMVESLAAATLLATEWDRRTTVVNPMCGSGTLAIEAALLATKRAPGLLRSNYSFMHFVGYNNSLYEAALQKIKNQVTEVENLKIIATDISEDAVNITKINATIAGVEDYLFCKVCDFEATKIPQENNGIVIMNPEYGDRLGVEKELEVTYKRIGDFLKQQCKGYTGFVFTGNLELAKKIGLKPKRRIEFFNSKIDCRLLSYELYEGTRTVAKVN